MSLNFNYDQGKGGWDPPRASSPRLGFRIITSVLFWPQVCWPDVDNHINPPRLHVWSTGVCGLWTVDCGPSAGEPSHVKGKKGTRVIDLQ